MLKAQSKLKTSFVFIAVISLLPQYANALSCAQPTLSNIAQNVIDHPENSAIVRGVLKLPEQQYLYDQNRFDKTPSTRSSFGTINGYIASANGFSTPILAKVEFKESCHRWPNTNICDKSDNATSLVNDSSAIYFLSVSDIGYILTSSDCSMNSMEETPENVKEIATCFINGGC